MNALKLDRVEDILTLPTETKCVSVSHKAVLYFLYSNNAAMHKKDTSININEVRKKYINMLNTAYNKKVSEQDIVFNYDDLQRIKVQV